MDFLAIVSQGAFPTPVPTGAERAAYAISRGLLGLFPTISETTKVGFTRIVLNAAGFIRVVLIKAFRP